MKQDINNLIEELTKVRPDELSTEGLKLFNKINEIIDKNKELEEYYEEQNEVNAKFIPVSLVEKTIEELDKKERQELKGLKGQDRYFVKQMYQYKRSVLQELLEKRK